jgi:hypothetical protein
MLDSGVFCEIIMNPWLQIRGKEYAEELSDGYLLKKGFVAYS